MRPWFAAGLLFPLLLASGPASAQAGPALDFAHGMAALDRGEHQLARESCGRAARGLEGDPATRQQLGRAQLCVVDGLVGLGMHARAFDVLTYAIRNLEDGGRTNPRYQTDLDRAMGMAGPLSRQIARVRITLEPEHLCRGPASVTLLLDEQPVNLATVCRGELLDVTEGPRALTLSAPGYQTIRGTVHAAPGRTTEARLVMTPDPSGTAWLQLRLQHPGAVLNGRGGQTCQGPCTLDVLANEARQGFYFVAEQGVMRPILSQGLSLHADGGRTHMPRRDLVRVQRSNLVDWLILAGGATLILAGSAVASADGPGAVTGFLALSGTVGVIVGLVMVLVPEGPPFYTLVDPDA